MSEEEVKGRPVTEEEQKLLALCKEYGIEMHPRAGAERMRKAILEGGHTIPWEVQEPPLEKLLEAAGNVKGKTFFTEEEYNNRLFNERKQEAGVLIRCRITCMNPNKKAWTGEIISVGSAKLGTFKKFIPFNSDQPYHVPSIIFNELKNRKCAVRSTRKGRNGEDITTTKLINEFALEVLPPLTDAELKDLQHQQAMANGTATA
jgi:hypothetical protein